VIDLGLLPYPVMPDVFAAADFIVHPATGEGFPVAIQEGMAAGLPIVLLWDRGYVGSVDRDAVTAVDSLSDLALAAQALTSDEARRTELGKISREYAVQNWSWEKTVEHHLELFTSAEPNT
jgi:glycosyltransferase involved in cell wall biosynthesis